MFVVQKKLDSIDAVVEENVTDQSRCGCRSGKGQRQIEHKHGILLPQQLTGFSPELVASQLSAQIEVGQTDHQGGNAVL